MRQVPKHIDDAFYEGHRSAVVPFCIDDAVDIIAGQYAGRSGSVISIEEVEPELTLLVELGDTGRDVTLPARILRMAEAE